MRTDLKNIAENLVNVMQILEEEYGIMPATKENEAKEETKQQVILDTTHPKASLLMPSPRVEKHRKDWDAPRKIGKPCTKGKFYRR